MNKKKTANLIMVLLILAIAIGGVVTAVLLKGHSDRGLGSQYKITAREGQFFCKKSVGSRSKRKVW